MSMTTTVATPEVAGSTPPHLRRVLAGIDGMIAQAEALKARWAATGDERSTAYVALADERLATLRTSRAAVLADDGRRRAVTLDGPVLPIVDDLPP
jgi:hypothetical protein